MIFASVNTSVNKLSERCQNRVSTIFFNGFQQDVNPDIDHFVKLQHCF